MKSLNVTQEQSHGMNGRNAAGIWWGELKPAMKYWNGWFLYLLKLQNYREKQLEDGEGIFCTLKYNEKGRYISSVALQGQNKSIIITPASTRRGWAGKHSP